MSDFFTTHLSIAENATVEARTSIQDDVKDALYNRLKRNGSLPALSERFFHGRAQVADHGRILKDKPLEDFYARVANVRQTLINLERELKISDLDESEKDKTLKDVAGINGTMTTFNILFKDKGAHFKGQTGSR